MFKDFGCFLNHSLELNDFCHYIYCEATLRTTRHLSGMLRAKGSPFGIQHIKVPIPVLDCKSYLIHKLCGRVMAHAADQKERKRKIEKKPQGFGIK